MTEIVGQARGDRGGKISSRSCCPKDGINLPTKCAMAPRGIVKSAQAEGKKRRSPHGRRLLTRKGIAPRIGRRAASKVLLDPRLPLLERAAHEAAEDAPKPAEVRPADVPSLA